MASTAGEGSLYPEARCVSTLHGRHGCAPRSRKGVNLSAGRTNNTFRGVFAGGMDLPPKQTPEELQQVCSSPAKRTGGLWAGWRGVLHRLRRACMAASREPPGIRVAGCEKVGRHGDRTRTEQNKTDAPRGIETPTSAKRGHRGKIDKCAQDALQKTIPLHH